MLVEIILIDFIQKTKAIKDEYCVYLLQSLSH